MKVQEYIKNVSRDVWEATAHMGGPSTDIRLTIHLDAQGHVAQEQDKSCTLNVSFYVAEGGPSQTRQSEVQSAHEI